MFMWRGGMCGGEQKKQPVLLVEFQSHAKTMKTFTLFIRNKRLQSDVKMGSDVSILMCNMFSTEHITITLCSNMKGKHHKTHKKLKICQIINNS